jgi:hypothetical protein
MVAVPAERLIDPESPFVEAPVSSVIEPDVPPSPVAMVTFPDSPALAAFMVWTVKLPLEDDVEAPELIVKDPPVPPVDEPAVILRSPPVDVPEPAVTSTEPAVLAASPVERAIEPELPMLDAPVVR